MPIKSATIVTRYGRPIGVLVEGDELAKQLKALKDRKRLLVWSPRGDFQVHSADAECTSFDQRLIHEHEGPFEGFEILCEED